MKLTTIAVVYVALICVARADEKAIHVFQMPNLNWNEVYDAICKSNIPPSFENWIAFCKSRTTTTTTAATATEWMDTTTTPTTSSINSLSGQNGWCKHENGTYLPRDYMFMRTECQLCKCTQSRQIHCINLECMPTRCIDNSKPIVKPGQCCPQCGYDTKTKACVINGVPFPHGTIVGETNDKNLQCWCQMGNIECRKTSAAIFSGLDYWGSGSAVYVIVIIICVILIIGTLLCCSGTLLFYYYYKRKQQVAEQNYAEYYNNAGWQPMSEDGQVVDEKQAEAQAQAQNPYQSEFPTGGSEEVVPPPYAIYNGSYEHEQVAKDGK